MKTFDLMTVNFTCPQCLGLGQHPGDDYDLDAIECVLCHGSKIINLMDKPVKCHPCKGYGAGKFFGQMTSNCPYCFGIGWVYLNHSDLWRIANINLIQQKVDHQEPTLAQWYTMSFGIKMDRAWDNLEKIQRDLR